MTISSSIREIIRLSKFVINARSKKGMPLVSNITSMPFPDGISQESQKFWGFLNSLPPRDVLIIRNLMYVGRDLNAYSKPFMVLYAEFNRILTQDISIAKSEIYNKIRRLDRYFSAIFIYAEAEKINIDEI
ncbi:hypothetical protein [Providencia stuartii]|uniref:hypothetical protein n=1 Tax=Providencia stuartii TaxID=588 RepID=UPI00149528A1|nr:hypothetical protein [Providencia stuartii]NPD43585.1 hypothetical protein [Providencia stuartii]NPD96869.1 hypothetical protein [Providencia stuartii]